MSTSVIAADVFGTLGAVCWSVQLIPQIWQNYRRQDTTGLQPTMMLLWASAGIPLGIYNITRDFPVALWIQPQILTFLSLITWAQTQYYPPARDENPRSKIWCAVVLGAVCAIAGAVEVGIVLGLRTATDTKTQHEVEYYWPVVLMGVLSAGLLAAGVGRHYLDIWKERTVRGISFLFVGIDALGDLTSLISVVFWWRAGRSLDILGLVIYGSELVLWLGVFACGGYYNFRPWLKSKIEGHKSRNAAQQESRNREEEQEPEAGHAARIVSSPTPSIVSQESYASGTVFRTASGQSIIAGQNAEADAGRDTLRLRTIVQV